MTRRLPRSFGCPAELTLAVLGGKWKTAILCYLSVQPMRYSELRRILSQVSDKVLTERLRELEYHGLVTRDLERVASAVTVYRLSARGESLEPMLSAVYRWGVDHAKTYGVRCDFRPVSITRPTAVNARNARSQRGE